MLFPFYFLFLKVCYLYPSFGDLFIHYPHQLLGFVLEKVSIFQILVKFLLFLHLGRAISYASYFYNPNTWFSGILLGIFLMATAFMGYVLPFGQMSFWGATVITNLLSPFPSLIEWVCGGYCVLYF
eukprot:UN2670